MVGSGVGGGVRLVKVRLDVNFFKVGGIKNGELSGRGGGGGCRVGEGQVGCERRIEVYVKNLEKNWGGGSGEGFGLGVGLGGQGGCD